jgi:hypothetical protein
MIAEIERDTREPKEAQDTQEQEGAALDIKQLEQEIADQEDEYIVENRYHDTGVFQAIARSFAFTYFTLFVILSNAIFLGVDEELNKKDFLWESDWPFVAAENFFCCYYVIEIGVRFFAFKHKRDSLRDGWFTFDLILVLLMIAETWITGLAVLISDTSFNLPTAPLRLLRMLRLSRLVRLARNQPELITMVKGMRKAMRAVVSTCGLLFLLVYAWAIVLHALLKEEETMSRWFGTLPLCMWTLLMDGTLLDSTGIVLTKARDLGWPSGTVSVIFFFAFMGMSAFMMMNLLIGVLCEVVSQVSSQERDEAGIKLVKESIMEELVRHDVDGSGTISNQELINVLSNPRSRLVLKTLKVDLNYLHDFRDLLVGNSTEIPIKKAMELVVMCRGDIPANVSNMADSQRITRAFIERAMLMVQSHLETGLARIEGKMMDVQNSIWGHGLAAGPAQGSVRV